MRWMFAACLPFVQVTWFNATFWFSASDLKPLPWIAEKCANTSSPPSAGVMKPKPLASLNHLTVPCAMECFPCNDWIGAWAKWPGLTRIKARSANRLPRGTASELSYFENPRAQYGPLRGGTQAISVRTGKKGREVREGPRGVARRQHAGLMKSAWFNAFVLSGWRMLQNVRALQRETVCMDRAAQAALTLRTHTKNSQGKHDEAKTPSAGGRFGRRFRAGHGAVQRSGLWRHGSGLQLHERQRQRADPRRLQVAQRHRFRQPGREPPWLPRYGRPRQRP